MNRLDITTLGPLAVQIDGNALRLGTRKQRALLALLIVNRRRTVSIDRIIMTLWGADAPPKRREDVWVYISRLRKSLGPAGHTLRRDHGGYVLDVEDDAIDSVRYEALVEEGMRLLNDDPAAASLVLGEALAAWAGGAFEEFETEDFLVAEIARLEESRLSALETRVRADLAWREAEHLIPEIEGLATEHPLRASLAQSLMVALYRRGRQAEALRAYDRYATRLADEAGLEPPEDMRILEEQILMDNPASRHPTLRLRTGLPERIATFVGREAELSDVSEALIDHRLVTVTGPGGIGKSSLALEAAGRFALDHDDVVLVDVARAEQPQDVPSVVADALRVSSGGDAMDQIIARLADRKALLIFDNCEPVVAHAASTIVELLQASAGVRIIATSRVVLGIPGEQIVRLAPLSTEPHGEAEQLLAQRILSLASSADEAIDPESLHTLCAKTDGLPLSIELVAAQLGTWSVDDVIAALDEPLETLSAPERVGRIHHREMRANIAWSEKLLPVPATMLLARLSVFRSSFSFEAVTAVAAFVPLDATSVKQEFRRLVNASMVLAWPGSTKRYYLLDPVRDYAMQRLVESGESDTVSENHASYFAERFATLGHAIDFWTDPESLRSAQPDGQDVTAAITWMSTQGHTAGAQRLATSAIPLWRATARVLDVLPILDALLPPHGPSSKTRAELLFMACPLYELGRGVEARRERFADLEAIAEVLGDPEIDAWWELRRADAATSHAAPEDVIALYRQAAASLHDVSSAYELNALHQLGWYQLRCWDRMDEAEATVAAWAAVCTSVGSGSPDADVLRGWVALARGDTESADQAFARTSAAYRLQGHHRSAALVMGPRAIASLQLGDAAQAGRRADVAVDASREFGAAPWLQNALVTRTYVRMALNNAHGAADDLLEVSNTIQPDGVSAVAAAFADASATALAGSRPEAAATLLGAASALPAASFALRIPRLLAAPAQEDLTGAVEVSVRSAIGSDAFDAAWTSGVGMDAETATTFATNALSEVVADSSDPSGV